MDAPRRRDVLEESWVWWPPRGGKPWLLTFAFLELGGRLECVGMEIRSYALRDETPETPPGQLGDAEPGAAIIAVEDVAAESTGFSRFASPRPLRATTLRQLDFANLLRHVQGTIVADFARDAETLRASGGDPWGPAVLEAASGALQPPERRGGRPLKYTRAHLERVAELYRAAYGSGSTRPTKDVGVQLGLSRDQAAKLVQRCRRLGLLGPTERRKAGGVEPPTTDEGGQHS